MNIVIDISEKVNREVILHVTDDLDYANKLKSDGHIVVPVITKDNSACDFSSFKYIVEDPYDVDEDYYYKIWQRYNNLPWTILTTKHCTIREMTVNDLDSLYKLYSDKEITRYTEPLFPDYEDELEYTHNYIHNVYEYWGFGTWIIERTDDKRIIGRAGFNYRPGYEYPELGYVLGVDYQGQGLATEVCKAILEYGFAELDFSAVMAFSSPDNTSSLRLLERLGFKPDKDLIPPDCDYALIGYILQR